jgi:ubiquinone/menaquinone biosynthesis C-methylase UbiE
MRRVLKPGGLGLVVNFEPPKPGLLQMIVEKAMTAMAHVDVREYVPLLEQAGYPDIQPGRTSSKLVSYVGGRAPGV